VQVRHDEGVAIHIGPEPCVGRGAHRPAMEPRKLEATWVPTCSEVRKATWTGAPSQVPAQPGVVGDPGMCGCSLYGNRETSGLTRGWTPLVRIGKAKSRNR
jgi:hypothetical protein